VSYWIADPENGQLALRSTINMLILAALREHKIEIPYPQRVMHMAGNAKPAEA
jgi:small-conductance mechanosensitive channel